MQIQILRAAESLGVAHVVKLSALGASDHSKSWIGREHHEVETALQQMSMTWTILRPHAFMQNWLGDVAESVRNAGALESPIGEGRVPFIDTPKSVGEDGLKFFVKNLAWSANSRHVVAGLSSLPLAAL